MYHVIAVNDRTGRKEYLTASSVTHHEGCVIMSKQTPKKKSHPVRVLLEPVTHTCATGDCEVCDHEAHELETVLP